MNYSLLLFHFLFLPFTACKSDGNAPQKPVVSTFLSMKINGVEWKATSEITGSLGVLQAKQFVLGGTATPGTREQNMNILLEDVTGPGTYTTSASATYNVAQYADVDTNGDIAMYKSQRDGLFIITITRCTGTITEGTFSGSLPPMLGTTETIVITDGKFSTL